MTDDSALGRRAFLGGLGATAGLGATGLGSAGVPAMGTTSAEGGVRPDFSGEDELRPHVLTWGGNSVFIVNKGIEETTHQRRKDAVLSTHPEAFWTQGITGFDGPPSETGRTAARVRGELELARDMGFAPPFGRATKFTSNSEDDWYQSLPREEKWRWPDGSIVETHTDVGVRRFDGSMLLGDGSDCEGGEDCEVIENYPSIHADGVQSFFEQTAVDYVSMGTNGIWLDQFDVRGRQRDFSAWAIDGFKEYLSGLSDAELDRLGVEDPTSLDVRAEIRERTPPSSGRNPATDPLYREYTKFDFGAVKDFATGIRDRLAEASPDRDPSDFLLFANLYGPFKNPHVAAILSDPLTLPVGESQETIPPNHIFDFNVKFYVAAGRYENSGFHQGRPFHGGEDRYPELDELDLAAPQTDYCAIQFAEQVANRAIGVATYQGSCCHGPIDVQPGNWLRPDGSIPDALQELTGFAWSIRELLRGGEFAHDVAVVRSIPTNLWRDNTGTWNRTNEPQYTAFGGASNVVMEEDRPYDVLLFGHPDLWDDTTMLDRLGTYEQVILPNVRCLSAPQRNTLQTALDDGLHVVIADAAPDRTADYEPLPDEAVDALLNHPNTTVLSGTPARDYWTGNGDGDKLRRALEERPRLVSTDADTDMELTVQTQQESDRVVLQAVNYDFDLDAEAVRTKQDLSVSLRDTFEVELTTARYYRPGAEPVSLAVDSSDGRLSIELPDLAVWGVVVLGPDADAVTPAGRESDATAAIDRTRSAIERADGEDRSEPLDDARRFLSYAETGARYGAYDRAATAAENALDTAQAATGRTTVGIDVAHNQPDVGYQFANLERFRETFVRDVEFVPVEEWSQRRFEAIDVLLVPPTRSYEGYNYEFTDREAELAGRFVEGGGGLLFFGGSGVPGDHQTLLDQFDIGFADGVVRNPDGFGADRAPRREAHQISQTTLELGRTGATSVVDAPDDATVLYEFPESADIWRDVCGDEARQDCDIDAAGAPFSVVVERGQGTVMVHGTDIPLQSRFYRDSFTQPWRPGINVVRNAVQFMQHRGAGATDSSLAGTTTNGGAASSSDGTTVSGDRSTTPASGTADPGSSTPGFSLLTAGLTALLGITYALLRDPEGEEVE